MGKISDIKSDFPEKAGGNPFTVPDNYFSELNGRVFDRIEEKEFTLKRAGARRRLVVILFSSAAAILIGFLVILPAVLNNQSETELTNEEIALVLESEIYDLDGYALESVIEREDIEKEQISEQEEFQEEIIQYLLDEDIELGSIIDEL